MENAAMFMHFLVSVLWAMPSPLLSSIVNPFLVATIAFLTFEILRILLKYFTDKHVVVFQIGLSGDKIPSLRKDVSTIVQTAESSSGRNWKNNMLKNTVFALLSQPETWVFGSSMKKLKRESSLVVNLDNVKLLEECNIKGMYSKDLVVVMIQVTTRGRGLNLPAVIENRESMKEALRVLHSVESRKMENVDVSWASDMKIAPFP